MAEKTLLEKIMEDPKKREKLFLFMTFAPIVASVLMVVGFIMFILILVGVV